ncbi:hypothetical protein BC827DRAFT_1246757 [Russula dissimulans]|nr:hypothetical protein BC827DRAFT_1246757 [Russula dissimulans]
MLPLLMMPPDGHNSRIYGPRTKRSRHTRHMLHGHNVTGTRERMGWHPLDRGKFMDRLCSVVCAVPRYV